jgi:hypothetical protein
MVASKLHDRIWRDRVIGKRFTDTQAMRNLASTPLLNILFNNSTSNLHNSSLESSCTYGTHRIDDCFGRLTSTIAARKEGRGVRKGTNTLIGKIFQNFRFFFWTFESEDGKPLLLGEIG